MKPGTRITLKNLPKNNGRAQLWIRMDGMQTNSVELFILYPTGAIITDLIDTGWIVCGPTEGAEGLVKWSGKFYFGGYI